MGIEVKVLADSIAPCGKRLITYEAKYPRAIHSEIMTHRMLTKSSASSRAIPVQKMIERVMKDPWIPEHIGKNQRGMQAAEQVSEDERVAAVQVWLRARDAAVDHALKLVELGIHKQVVNRLLEPWMYIVVVISGTEWNNFFALRDHEAAEPHFQELARGMRAARKSSTPVPLKAGEWHLPYVEPWDRGVLWDRVRKDDCSHLEMCARHDNLLVRVSVARCARVSYLTQDGRRDHDEDLALHDRLLVQRPLHAAPAEHVAMALDTDAASGNFRGFLQYRKTLPFECVEG